MPLKRTAEDAALICRKTMLLRATTRLIRAMF